LKIEEETTGQNIMSASATQGGHNYSTKWAQTENAAWRCVVQVFRRRLMIVSEV